MPVANSVKEILEKRQLEYTVSQAPGDALAGRSTFDRYMRQVGGIRSQLVEDDNGTLLVLFPGDCMLDLRRLSLETGRQLTAAKPNSVQSMQDKLGVQSIPALPNIAGLRTLVDERLLDKEHLKIDSGGIGELVILSKDNFKPLMENVEVADICVTIDELEALQPQGDDETEITNAVKNFTTMRIQQRLEETLELPPLPQTAQRIIKLRVDPNADVSDLATIVETDPSLAAQVVSWAASPYYSAPGKIKSVHDAIVRVLGFDMVLNLSLGLSLGKTLNMPKDGPRGVTPYWQQAVYTAATMEALVTAIPRAHRPGFGLAYLSGLLNNFGYLILAEVFPPHFETICRYIETNPHISTHLIERHILGVTREQIVSWLMGVWHLPEEVCTALRHQQHPGYEGEHHEYANLTFAALRLLRQQGIGTGPREPVPEILYERLHLEHDRALEAIDNVLESSEELQNIAQALDGA
ncbi:MAG: HDOD domain-containing protein [Cellvibrionaceae bacterium]